MNDQILFVWDFHGVLEKGNEKSVEELCNLVLKDFGFERRINLKEVVDWYGLNWLDYFKLTVPEGTPELWQKMKEKVLSFQERGWEIIKKNIKAREFAKSVLEKIKNKGHQNILLTNAQPEHAKKFTELIGINTYLDAIIGVDSPYDSRRKDEIHIVKGDNLTSFLNGKEYRKIVLIGDKESDIKAGKICRAATYLFVDPENANAEKETEADYTISDLREVLRELD